jgi:heme/copper-type cytochrome/quinol oxidase subunit 2
MSNRIGRWSLVLLCLLVVLTDGIAWGCPNCKDALANDPAAAGLVRGYFYSILFMLSMPFLIFSGLSSYFYWEICRARAQQQLASAEVAEVATEETPRE